MGFLTWLSVADFLGCHPWTIFEATEESEEKGLSRSKAFESNLSTKKASFRQPDDQESLKGSFCQDRNQWFWEKNKIMESMSSLSQARVEVEQLRREAAIKRIPVSQVVEDIKRYILDNEDSDCLVVGFTGKNSNPFKEKSSCQVL